MSRYRKLRRLEVFLFENQGDLPLLGRDTWRALATAVKRKADAQDTGNSYLAMTAQAAAVDFTNKLIEEMLNDATTVRDLING